MSLQWASDELKDNYEVALTAIKENHRCGFRFLSNLKYTNNKINNDYELMLYALNKDKFALRFISKELKNNKKFLPEAHISDKELLNYNY